MNLEAMLGELRENVLRDDAELASGPNDQLWTDETLVRYINDAQQRFARKTLSLRDASTPEVVQFTLATGVSTYVLHASVLAVVTARYNTDTVDLARVGRARIVQFQPNDPPWFDPNNVSQMTPGRPLAFSTDEAIDSDQKGSVTLVVYPTPTSAENNLVVYLRVARLPLVEFDIDDLDTECELDDDYHLDMLEWAAYRALMNSDIDGHSDSAEKHKDRFTDAVNEVLKDVRRKMRVPMRFEFGQNGFTW
jgi:hypothetical protein